MSNCRTMPGREERDRLKELSDEISTLLVKHEIPDVVLAVRLNDLCAVRLFGDEPVMAAMIPQIVAKALIEFCPSYTAEIADHITQILDKWKAGK